MREKQVIATKPGHLERVILVCSTPVLAACFDKDPYKVLENHEDSSFWGFVVTGDTNQPRDGVVWSPFVCPNPQRRLPLWQLSDEMRPLCNSKKNCVRVKFVLVCSACLKRSGRIFWKSLNKFSSHDSTRKPQSFAPTWGMFKQPLACEVHAATSVARSQLIVD